MGYVVIEIPLKMIPMWYCFKGKVKRSEGGSLGFLEKNFRGSNRAKASSNFFLFLDFV